jgi:hypothetical protein
MRGRGRLPHGGLRRLRRAAGDSRGFALVTALLLLFALGMMLFGFMFINQNEGTFASINRSSTQALGLAEAGAQEAVARLGGLGTGPGSVITPGTTTFNNSLASSSSAQPGSSGTVYYQAAVAGNQWLFPALSTATYAGAQRNVRIFIRAVFRSGTGTILYGSQVIFNGDASLDTGDVYSSSSVTFASFKKSPLCATGATATNLAGVQVLAGSTIGAGAGPAPSSIPCGLPPANVNGGTFTGDECASDTFRQEVAPTPCARATDIAGEAVPVNWHPQTPIGMSSADFTAVMNASSLPAALDRKPAEQGGVNVGYTPLSYTPSYWSSPTYSGKVMLITSTQPFCVNPTTGTVSLTIPVITGICPIGSHYYGAQTSGLPNGTRYVDWNLIDDDLKRPIAQTFFQAPTCTAPCATPGNPNGIRYIPFVPTLNISSLFCTQSMNPGTNVFDAMTLGDPTCPNPPITQYAYPGNTNVTFSGTKSNPESLVIDNSGYAGVNTCATSVTPNFPGDTVCITPSISGSSTLTCDNLSTGSPPGWDSYNWGLILATGDLAFSANLVFSGFIYTPGNLFFQGTPRIHGGTFSATPLSNTPPTVSDDASGNMAACAGTGVLPLSPLFFTFQPQSWQDRSQDKP